MIERLTPDVLEHIDAIMAGAAGQIEALPAKKIHHGDTETRREMK